MKDGFQSDKEPLDLRFLLPTVPAGSLLEPFSVKFVLGAARSLAALIVAEIVVSMGVSPGDFDAEDQHVLESLSFVTCTYTPCTQGLTELVSRSVNAKMRRRLSKVATPRRCTGVTFVSMNVLWRTPLR